MSNNLLIGTGGCGNKLLNTTINIVNELGFLKSTYDYLFVNSNAREMSQLENFNPQLNGLVINGNGTGRNRDVAKESLKSDKPKILSFFDSKINNYDAATIVFSCDGGFGSGSVNVLAHVLRQLSPKIKINLLGAMPKLSSRKASLENSISLFEDVIKLRKMGVVNSVQFIDNDKMKNEDEFNREVMSLFIKSIEIDGGSLDIHDSLLVNSANGYKATLPLDNKFRSLQDAIDSSMKSSLFVMPSKLNCTHMGATVIKDDFDKDEVANSLPITVFDKCDYGNENIIVLGGCGFPDDHISMLEEALKDLNNTNIDEEVSSFRRTTENTVTPANNNQEPKKEISAEQKMRNMMTASFWD